MLQSKLEPFPVRIPGNREYRSLDRDQEGAHVDKPLGIATWGDMERSRALLDGDACAVAIDGAQPAARPLRENELGSLGEEKLDDAAARFPKVATVDDAASLDLVRERGWRRRMHVHARNRDRAEPHQQQRRGRRPGHRQTNQASPSRLAGRKACRDSGPAPAKLIGRSGLHVPAGEPGQGRKRGGVRLFVALSLH
jgi:hypothetical protein